MPPEIHQEVRYVNDNGQTRKAFVTSFIDDTPTTTPHLHVLIDINDPSGDYLQWSVPYSSTITDTHTWHYIEDETP